MSDFVKNAHKLQEMQHLREIREKSVQYSQNHSLNDKNVQNTPIHAALCQTLKTFIKSFSFHRSIERLK